MKEREIKWEGVREREWERGRDEERYQDSRGETKIQRV
jgi:hypothetical protein